MSLKQDLVRQLLRAGKVTVVGTRYSKDKMFEVTDVLVHLKTPLHFTQDKSGAAWIVNPVTGTARGTNKEAPLVFALSQIPSDGSDTLRIELRISTHLLHHQHQFSTNLLLGFEGLGKSLEKGEPWFLEQ